MTSIPKLAIYGDQGSGKTTVSSLAGRFLQSVAIDPAGIFVPKFADPLYEVLWWLTGSKHRVFLQELADAIRGCIGEQSIVRLFSERIAAAASGQCHNYLAPARGSSPADLAAVCLSWFKRSDASACQAEIVATISRHFGNNPEVFRRTVQPGSGGLVEAPARTLALICDDARKPSELDALRAEGFLLLRVVADLDVRRVRCEKTGIWQPDHSTEGMLNDMPAHFTVANNSDDLATLSASLAPAFSCLAGCVWNRL